MASLNRAPANEGRQLFDSVEIVAGPQIDAVERRYVELLERRLAEIARIAIGTAETGEQLHIYLGTLQSHPRLSALADQLGIALPNELDPGPEGFVFATGKLQEKRAALLMGVDRRGVLYAIGELLRQIEGQGDRLGVPANVELRRAPRWPVRGLLVVQGYTMRELTGARAWSLAEWQRAHLDYALAGANTFEIPPQENWKPIYDMIRDYGLRAHSSA